MSFRGRLGVALCRANKESVSACVCRDVFRENVTGKKMMSNLSEIPRTNFSEQDYEQLSALSAPSRLCR